MSMLKVIEVLAESDESQDASAQVAVDTAGESVRNVRSIYIKNHEVSVKNGKIKISFALARFLTGLLAVR